MKGNRIYLFFILAPMLFMGAITADASNCEWVETIGEAVVENITPDEAKQLALNRARNKAIENVSGINVSGNTLVKDYSLIADLIRVAGSGYILEEKIMSWETSSFQERADMAPVTLYRVKIKSCVKGESEGDPYFKIKGELNRSVFIEGEEAKIKIRCTKDCYLTILNLTAENKVRVLLPNEYESSKQIKEGEEYNFPIEGLSLEMGTLPGHKKDAEAFILIATKERFGLLNNKGKELNLEDFYKLLTTIPADSRTEEILLYEVRKKE